MFTSKERTFLVIAVLFVAGGIQFIHPYLSESLYTLLNSIVLGIEGILQVNSVKLDPSIMEN